MVERLMHKINGRITYSAKEIREVYNGSPTTFLKCDELEPLGYRFIPGNAPFMNRSKKWGGYTLIRVAQVNSKLHGRSTQTLWAVKEASNNVR